MNREKNGVPYLSFSVLEETGLVLNGFSTRLGGASRGKYATMNFAWNKGDDPADVLENYTRMAEALTETGWWHPSRPILPMCGL